MSIQSLSDLVTASGSSPAKIGSTAAAQSELVQEFISWHEANIGPVVNAQESLINRYLMKASSLAVRSTRNAVQTYLLYGVAWEDIEPVIKEGIFIYTAEELNPAYASKNEKTVENAHALMLEFFYSQDLVKA